MSSQEPTEFQLFFWEGGEEGSAYYSRNMGVPSWPLMDPAKHQLGSAIENIPFSVEDGRPFTIADYGCRDGGVSVPVMQHLIDCVRQKQNPMPDVHIMYEDQPYNDFKSLFLMANGLTGAECEPAWSEQDGVYFSAVGRSFYEQCFPCNSVHVGFSSYSMVYISTRPCLLPDVLHYTLATDDKTKALFAKQGALDWETFLLHRCRELVPGGLLYLVANYMTEDGQYEGATKGGRNVCETVHSIWKQLYEEGRIKRAEFEEPTWNQYVRSVDEFKAPFLNENSTVYREGLRLIFLETKIFPCDLQERLKQCGANDPDVVAEIAHELVMSIRPWANGDFLAALSSRPEAERREIVDELFQRFEAQIRAEPTLHKEDSPTAYIMLQKISEQCST